MYRRNISAVYDEENGNVEKVRSEPVSEDPSAKMWFLSISQADKFDTAVAERWKADMDGILVYAGIFSATVAAFLIEIYKTLMPDPLEVSSMLLQQVVQELVEISNGDHLTPPVHDSFEPHRYAIHVNILWFLSLSISLSCCLGATLMQQWVCRYLQLTRHADTPIHRVRIRTFLFSGIQEIQVRMFVENVSLLLHVAILLFCAGLIEFFLAINNEVAQIVRAVICFLWPFISSSPVSP